MAWVHARLCKLQKGCTRLAATSTMNQSIKSNMVVSNQFHSVKNFLFSSAKPRDFDGMFGTGLLVSMYTTKTPIDKCRFNSAVLTLLNLKNFYTFSVKDRYQLNYLIFIKDFNAQTITLKKKKNLYLLLSAS